MAGTITRVCACARRLAQVGIRAAGVTLSWSISLAPIAQGLERTNFHGRTVSLRGGAGAAAGSVMAAIETGRLLRSGSRVRLAAALALSRHRSEGVGGRPLAATAVDAASSAVVIASWANLLNLLDLRPGRALKTASIVSAPLLTTPGRDGEPTRLLAAGTLGVSLMALPEDLLENTMLGDTGANAVGALLGTALACHPGRAVRVGAAVSGVGLILASEKVSFSRVIANTPVLAALDGLGRRP